MRCRKGFAHCSPQLAVWRSEPEEGFTLAEWMPPVDIEESDKEYLIKAELPGMKKEEVKLKVEGGTLSISGERKAEKEEKDKKYHRVERSYGAFSRSFTLPEGALAEKISAVFKDGVLMVHLPKAERAKTRAQNQIYLCRLETRPGARRFCRQSSENIVAAFW